MFAAFFVWALPGNAQTGNPDAGDIETGLVGWWKLDDENGTQITDSSSNANHGSWIDNENTNLTEESIRAKVGLGLAMDADDRITIPSIVSYNMGSTGSFSVSIWFKTSDSSLTFMDIGSGNQIIQMGMDAGRIRFSVRDSLGNSTNLPYNLPYGPRNDDKWHLASLVVDRANNSAHVYIDDAQEQIDTDISNMVGNIGAITQFRFNGNSNGAEFDDVRYYNRALSADDVALLYRSYPGQVACSADYEAVMWFNHNEKVMQYCNGTDWVNVGEIKSCATESCGGNPSERVVFISSPGSGSYGGLSGADSICQTEADNAGLSGTYFAWLADSDPNSAPAIRFEKADRKYVMPNGEMIANNWTDLTDGNIQTELDRLADGNNFGSTRTVRTNVNPDGTQFSSTDHCNNYTNNSGPTLAGDAARLNSEWTNAPLSSFCNNGHRLYCFEQGPIAADGCTSPTGKAGEIDYNLDDGVMQYCDGANWISMGPKSGEAGTSALSLSPPAPTNGLVGHWTLDDTNTTVIDSLGSNDGSMQGGLDGSADSVAGKFGTALNFDGTDDYITLGSTTNIAPSNVTACLWADRQGSGSGNNWQELIGNGDFNNYGWHLNFEPENTTATFFVVRSGARDSASFDLGSTAGWNFYCGSFDGTNARLYVNGVLRDTSVATSMVNSTADIYLGSAGPNSPGNDSLDGNMDDVRIFNRALTDEEIEALYKFSSLVGHWKLDETTGTTAADSSGNGNDGTVNGTDFDTGSVASPSGGGITFDGNDYIDISSAIAAISTNHERTLSIWVKLNSITGSVYRAITLGNIGLGTTMSIGFSGSGQPRAYYRNSGLDEAESPDPLSLDIWYHLTAVYSDTNVKLFINGILSREKNDVAPLNTYPVSANNIKLGSNPEGNNNFLDGSIDDVRIYNRALSASEVANLYATTGGGTVPNTNCLNIGDICDDGTMYAGKNPVSDEDLYVTPSQVANDEWALSKFDIPQSEYWNDGQANQNHIVQTYDVNDFPVFAACANGSYLGYNDWYLPSIVELDTIYSNLVIAPPGDDPDNPVDPTSVTDGAGSTSPPERDGPLGIGSTFWSSSQNSNNNAWAYDMNTGQMQQNIDKGNSRRVICMRKGNIPVGGSCSSPDGVAGEIVYNDDYNIMQYCNGKEWVAVGSDYSGNAVVQSPAPTTGDCTNIGDVCPDGSIYAGLTPDTNIRMFTTPANAAGTYSWNNGNSSNQTTTGQSSAITGAANTDAIVAVDADSGVSGTQPHLAAQYCYDLSSHGKGDWYLPAENELDVLYINRASIGSFPTGTYYWSSTENAALVARYINFSNGNHNGAAKENSYNVRCVRKDSTSTITDTTPDAFTYVDKINVPINTTNYVSGLSVTITGINAPTPVTVTVAAPGSNGYFRVNGGPWVTSGTVNYNDSIGLRFNTPATTDTTFTITVDVGGVTDTLDVTTVTSGGPAGCPNIGDTCPDGSLFLGLYDYGSGDEQIFITSSYSGGNLQWKTSSGTDDIAANDNDGRVNVAQLSPISSFPAAAHCDGLTAHGNSDWYLPSINETELFINSTAAINYNGNKTWTSSEFDNARSVIVLPNAADFASADRNENKTDSHIVRCIRRASAGGSCDITPWTQTSPSTYTFTLPAGCTGATVEAYGAGGAGSNDKGGGGGGGASAIIRDTGSTLIAVGGGGGGAGGKNLDDTNGGGGGYAQSILTGLTPGETFTVYVGGGGYRNGGDNGGAGGAVGGGAASGGNGNPATNDYGGGGGGERDSSGGNAVHGGAGGAGRDGSPAGSASGYGGDGGAGGDQPGLGGSGFSSSGGTVISGGNGGATGVNAPGTAANSGPGIGAYGDTSQAGNGQVVITPAP